LAVEVAEGQRWSFEAIRKPWFSVQAGACTEIISFPYTRPGRDPSGPRISLNHPQIAPIRKTVPFRTSAGRPCSKVYVARKTPELLRQIPATIAGHPVAVEQTGAFKALDR